MIYKQIILKENDAIKQNPNFVCGEEILNDQKLLDIKYINFDGKVSAGQIVVNKKIANDIKKIFEFIFEIKFPIALMIPVSNFNFDDILSMENNNTSAFNFRKIMNTEKLSNHALGMAIDINPFQNIYIKYDNAGKEIVRYPENSIYDKNQKGTLYENHPVVLKFKEFGFDWGGDWENPKDYQHFEKII